MIIELVAIFLTIILFLFCYIKWVYTHWERQGIPSVPATFPFGSVKDILFYKKTICELFVEYYNQHKGSKLVGFYGPIQPFLLVRDPELIKIILVREFNSFNKSGFNLDKNVDKMFGLNPFTTENLQEWKNLRAIHTSIHTGTKMKSYHSDMMEVSKNLIKYISRKINEPIDMLEVSRFYTADVVASTGYGVKPCLLLLDEEESLFKTCVNQILTDDANSKLSINATLFMPIITKLFRLRVFSEKCDTIFVKLGKTCVEHREGSGTVRNDLIQHLINLNKKLKEENKEGFSDIELAAHCFTLFIDGFLTSATVLAFVLHKLAVHLDVQEKLREEIKNVEIELDNFDHDKIASIEYLDMVIQETLRLHPPVHALSRTCTNTIKLDGVKITPGIKVYISTEALQRDPEHFTNPEKFDPERFSKINRTSINKYVFLPFGEGPRQCLGSRFGQTQIRTVLVALLSAYRISLSKDTPRELQYSKDVGFLTEPVGKVNLIFTPI